MKRSLGGLLTWTMTMGANRSPLTNRQSDVRDAWLQKVRAIQSWQSGGLRAPHKPLLLLYALGRLQRSGKAAVSFVDTRPSR